MSLIKGIKVGSINIKSTYNSEDDEQGLEITQVSLNSIDTPNNEVYTGIEYTPTPAVYAYLGNDNVKTELTLNTDYTLSYSNNINVGTATVTATGINNFTGTVSATWIISSAEISITKEDQSYVYNGYPQGSGITVSISGNQTPVIRYRITYSGEYNLTDVPLKTHVSESGLVYYKVTADNHQEVTGSYQLDITRYTASLTWGDLIWTYDGDEHSTTCVVNNLISTDDCSVILTGNSITDIGTVEVKASSLTNNDYTLPTDGIIKTLTVSPGLFIKKSNTWIPVKAIYKKINGTWEEQSLIDTLNTEYLYMEKSKKLFS